MPSLLFNDYSNKEILDPPMSKGHSSNPLMSDTTVGGISLRVVGQWDIHD